MEHFIPYFVVFCITFGVLPWLSPLLVGLATVGFGMYHKKSNDQITLNGLGMVVAYLVVVSI